MTDRLKILISAYACEPGKGSEPEVGWQWATRMAGAHDVTVVTRSNNRPAIEAALGSSPVRGLEFSYVEASLLLLRLKKFLGVRPYYLRWQALARQRIDELGRKQKFDLLHHVTFASCRYGTAIWGHGVPTLWGPVGGLESAPWSLLRWDHPVESFKETMRNFDNSVQRLAWSAFARRARNSSMVLASTREVAAPLQRLAIPHELFPTIGLSREHISSAPRRSREGPLRLLFVGKLLWLKGMDLAIEALARVKAPVRLTFVGGGDRVEQSLRALATRLGRTDQVEFRGQQSRAQVLEFYAQNDVFIFPSQHDSGGFAVIEAMAAGLPVICLDCGGPAIAVAEGCGRRIPLGSRGRVVAGLAGAIDAYAAHPQQTAEDGERARLRILAEYEWDAKARHMDGIYRRLVRGEPLTP
jgi:glycosyltransferase involved in cell wall biosynthesis